MPQALAENLNQKVHIALEDTRKHAEVWQIILENRKEETSGNADEASKISRLLSIRRRLDENDFADPLVKETIRSFSAIAEIQRDNGEPGCHRYIISNCQSALNVVEVPVLAALVMPQNVISSVEDTPDIV